MPQPLHTSLGSPRFVCLCAANFLVHLSLFAVLPQWVWMATRSEGTAAAWLLPMFFLGMALPGAAGARMLERYSRKGVCLRSTAALCAVSLLSLLLMPKGFAVLPLLLLQGAAYGLLQMSLGSTLVNDILPSPLRSRGDAAYAWAGRSAIAIGLLSGTLASKLLPTAQGVGFTLVPAALAFLLVAQTQIPVKAPVRTPLFSLDRFFLPSLAPFFLTLAAAPAALGCYAAADTTAEAYALLAAGQLAAIPFTRLLGKTRHAAAMLAGAGYLLLGASAVVFFQAGSAASHGCALSAIFCGAGAATLSHAHLIYMLRRADHCQRGTVQNSYLLFWWLSFAAGFALTLWHAA